jgi:transcriptional regulator with GAF, ATPase, and Fis domain
MPMRATTVRFSDDLWALLEAEAGGQGVSAAQFVRDATLLRLGALAARRGDGEATTTLEDLASRAVVRRPAMRPPAVRHRARLDALRATGLLDSLPEEAYERLTGLARDLLQAPVALISLVDEDRQFFKSAQGLGEPWASRRETPLSHSICQYALAGPEPLVIEDARADARYCDSLAIPDLDVVAYAGIPLLFDGHALGTLCVIDHVPRAWTPQEVERLRTLAAAVVTEIELRASRRAPTR